MSMRIISVLLALIGVWLGGLALDYMPRGEPYTFSLDKCGEGSLLTQVEGVSCTGTRQDRGWPVVSNSTYSNLVGENGAVLPGTYFECHSGCGRGLGGWNTLIVASVVGVIFAVLKSVTTVRLNRQLREHQHTDTKEAEEAEADENLVNILEQFEKKNGPKRQ